MLHRQYRNSTVSRLKLDACILYEPVIARRTATPVANPKVLTELPLGVVKHQVHTVMLRSPSAYADWCRRVKPTYTKKPAQWRTAVPLKWTPFTPCKWVVFDMCNGSYYDNRHGQIWTFMFDTRADARAYVRWVRQRAKDGVDIIDVTYPIPLYRWS